MTDERNGTNHQRHGLGEHLHEARSLITHATHGAASIVKTQVLGMDRVSDAVYEARLSICRTCPGGHARFRKDGSLHTCGPMLKSMAQDGRKTCGCILSKKARGAKESCPFGYWPTIERQSAGDGTHDGPVVAAAMSELQPLTGGLGVPIPAGVLPGAWEKAASGPLGRRAFLARSLSALAAATVVPAAGVGRALAADKDPSQCFIPIDPMCDDEDPGTATHVRCPDVQGWFVGDLFKGDDDKCYKLASAQPDSSSGTLATVTSGPFSNCDECGGSSSSSPSEESSEPSNSSSPDSSHDPDSTSEPPSEESSEPSSSSSSSSSWDGDCQIRDNNGQPEVSHDAGQTWEGLSTTYIVSGEEKSDGSTTISFSGVTVSWSAEFTVWHGLSIPGVNHSTQDFSSTFDVVIGRWGSSGCTWHCDTFITMVGCCSNFEAFHVGPTPDGSYHDECEIPPSDPFYPCDQQMSFTVS